MKTRSGFTLVEIMIVAICLALLMGPIFMVLRSGTQTSLKGMLRIDTTLEARRVIRQVHADLKMACFPLPLSSVFNFDDVLKISGTPPKNVYSFLSYPAHQKMSEIFTSQTSGINFRDLSEITYTVEDNGDPEKPALKLVREEKFGGKTTKRILSNRVNFFEIKPIMLQPQGKNQFYYFVTLQLLDAVHPSEMQGNTPGDKITDEVTGVILADFFDVVYPEYFHSMWNQLRTVPNWHTLLRSPGG
ncbi:MAG: PulJ/GspJ family protein [Candidatus Rifleibacteriota bacterium]